MRFVDLHLHSHFSDGTYSPAELAAQARRCGLAAIALTDHDSLEGCPGTAVACAAAGIEFIAGTELTAEQDGNELHLLGYFLEAENPSLLVQLARFQAVRQDRVREMVARLNKLRVPLSAEAVFALANCRAPGRPHVARALVRAGFCANLDEAFERFLKKNRPAWVPKFKMSAGEAINLIHQGQGVAVLAHPGLNRTDRVIPGMVKSRAGRHRVFPHKTLHGDQQALPGAGRPFSSAGYWRLGLPRVKQRQTVDRHRQSAL